MPVRVVIEPGSHAVLNLGDVAMLQVAVRRLRDQWPDATLSVLTSDPEALARHVPGVEPLPASGRYEGTPAHAQALAEADLVVMSGRGGTTDAFLGESLAVLDEIELALRAGTPVAMMGQGVGPLRDPGLVGRAAAVLPRIALLAVRERALAPALLEALGVPGERVAVTGDDAVEAAFAARPDGPAATGIGLSLRVADYAAVDEDTAAGVARAARAAAARLGSGLVPIPISMYPAEDEAGRLGRLSGNELPPVATVAEAVARAGGCRAVVAGSYHAALFAAAQGVPVVAVARSPYYVAKMQGLHERFGGRVRVVRLGGRLLDDRIESAVDAAWRAADSERTGLLDDAERQVDAGRAAYARLPELAAVG